ncbi:MAG TPA: CPBP family intramembrane glutamic endopeptidase [Candidatus Sulfotelmatobacter sp.]|nr:CPBP family intramembrane glutamic endopeptidase [Candidatus Sulfotelmatobacter sp.]
MDDRTDWEAEGFRESTVRRAATFLRSVIPLDPTQLLFLMGAILLLVATRVSWRPYTPSHSGAVNYWEHYGSTVVGNLVVLAAGLTALYACFWPLRNPVRKVFWAVLVAGLLGLLFHLWKFFDLTVGERSVLDTRNRMWEMFPWVKLNTPNLPTGFFILALGLGLVAVYLSRMALQIGTLPLALSNVITPNEEERQSWFRDKLVLFVLIGVFGFLAYLSYLLATLIWKLPLAYVNTRFTGYVFSLATALLDAGLLLGFSMYALGTRGRTAARLSLKVPELRFAAMAFLLPTVAYALIPAVHFVLDRRHWAAYDFGRFGPPLLSTYFDLSGLGQPWIVFLLFGAFTEEIIFRGVLLPDFIRRYGLHRGIFLTGIGWAAIHFRSDSYTRLSVLDVFLVIFVRIILCLGMNYVLAWMALHWRSIVPAGIAHTVWNMLVLSDVSDRNETRYIDCGLWLMIAFCLFRFWPVVQQESDAGMEAPNLEPAV